jgi:predicted DNA-binding transcriptional regulator AlpA
MELGRLQQKDGQMSIEHSPARGMRVLRRKQITKELGISDTTLYQWIKDGEFPAPIKLGPNTSAWLADEIEAVIRKKAAARPQQLEMFPAEE